MTGNAPPSRVVTEFASALPPGRALDLACGTGRNAVWLAEHGWEVVGVDRSPEAIDIMRSRAAAIDARVMDLEAGLKLPFDDESFDLVLVIHFLHRPLFAEAKRVTKPGGRIITAIHLRAAHRFVVAPGELRSFFDGWTLEHDREAGDVAEIVAVRASRE